MKKRILIVVAGNYNGAIARCSWNLYSAYKKRNQDYDVKCVLLSRVKNGMKEYHDVDTYTNQSDSILLKFFPVLSKILWLRRIKSEFKPDYTISTLFSVNLINVLSGGRGKKIGIFHSPYKQERALGVVKYFASLLSYLFVYPHLDKLACVSSEVKLSLHNFPTISKKKVEVIYNIHNIDDIICKSNVDVMSYEEKEIFKHPVILYCGRMDYNKAPDRALKAFALSCRPENAELVFIGVDKCNMISKLYQIASEYSIEDKIHILGKKDNPYPYFRQAHALISSSYNEGLPGVIIESLILGTPIVATNSSKGIWEIFSVVNQYNENLSGVFECECGFISSNLAYRSKNMDKIDIENLKLAIENVWNKDKVLDFKFKNMVSDNIIIKQLIK